LYYKNNIGGTLNLIEKMLAYKIRNIIFSSSATVYGIPHKLPISEDFPLSTSTPYGATKLHIERILADVANTNQEISVTILRYFNPIGTHESGLIGEKPCGTPNNLAPYIAQVAVGLRPEVFIFGNDYETVDGTGVRDFIHVVDLALGHVASLEKIKDTGVHIYNLGTGHGTSVLQLLHAFEKSCGKTIPYKVVARRARDVGECYANCDKAKRELGWVATKSIDEAAKSMLKFYKSINSLD
jgi:UDP-glucose 4-epimerase